MILLFMLVSVFVCNGVSMISSSEETKFPDRDNFMCGESNNRNISKQKKKRNPDTPEPNTKVIALSPEDLLATHHFVCPEPACIHHNPRRALRDSTRLKLHYSLEHCENKWNCLKCIKLYHVETDWKEHVKTCGAMDYRCHCGTSFTSQEKDSFHAHIKYCKKLTQEGPRLSATNTTTHQAPPPPPHHPFQFIPANPNPIGVVSLPNPPPPAKPTPFPIRNISAASLLQELILTGPKPLGIVGPFKAGPKMPAPHYRKKKNLTKYRMGLASQDGDGIPHSFTDLLKKSPSPEPLGNVGPFKAGPKMPGPDYRMENNLTKYRMGLSSQDGDGIPNSFTGLLQKSHSAKPLGNVGPLKAGPKMPAPHYRKEKNLTKYRMGLASQDGDGIPDSFTALLQKSLSPEPVGNVGPFKASPKMPAPHYRKEKNLTKYCVGLASQDGDGIPDSFADLLQKSPSPEPLGNVGPFKASPKMPSPRYRKEKNLTEYRVGLASQDGDGIPDSFIDLLQKSPSPESLGHFGSFMAGPAVPFASVGGDGIPDFNNGLSEILEFGSTSDPMWKY